MQGVLRNAMNKLYALIGFVLIILVAACGCATQNPYGPTPTPTVTTSQTTSTSGSTTIIIQNFAFNPASITISRGSTVTWTNQDSVQHQIINDATATAGQGQIFESSPIGQGQSYSFTFTTAGTYPYHCNIHPYMKGTVIVT